MVIAYPPNKGRRKKSTSALATSTTKKLNTPPTTPFETLKLLVGYKIPKKPSSTNPTPDNKDGELVSSDEEGRKPAIARAAKYAEPRGPGLRVLQQS